MTNNIIVGINAATQSPGVRSALTTLAILAYIVVVSGCGHPH